MTMTFAQRIALPFVGWITATVVSSLVLVAGMAATIPTSDDIVTSPVNQRAMIVLVWPIVLIVMAVLTALPWLAITWVMHGLGLRARWISAVAGSAMGACLMLVTQDGGIALGDRTISDALVFGIAGFAGGWVYRVIADSARH